MILKEYERPVRVPAGIYEPLPPGTLGLLADWSSLTIKGVKVHLGINSDYMGEIQILISSLVDFHIIKGDWVVQLLVIPLYD